MSVENCFFFTCYIAETIFSLNFFKTAIAKSIPYYKTGYDSTSLKADRYLNRILGDNGVHNSKERKLIEGSYLGKFPFYTKKTYAIKI